MVETLKRTSSGKMPYFAALDGVRAWCIVLVIYNHLKANGHLPGWINGHLGVDVFFVLSGFLITTLLAREKLFTGKVDLVAFYWRRFFRIVPVYAVTLLLYIGVTHLHGQQQRWNEFRAGLPWFLTFTNEFVREPNHGTVFAHSWSLGVEEKFYLLWPLLAFFWAKKFRGRVYLLLFLFLAVAVAAVVGQAYLARAYCGLGMGCLLAVMLTGPVATHLSRLLHRLPGIVVLGLLVLGFYLELLSKDLFTFFSLSAAIFVGYVALVPGWLAQLHELRFVRWIGQRSYSMYLVHILCLNVIESRLRATSWELALCMLGLAILLTAGVAEILHRLVEQPVRRAGRAWLARRGEVARAM